jgi:hypothetical protein
MSPIDPVFPAPVFPERRRQERRRDRGPDLAPPRPLPPPIRPVEVALAPARPRGEFRIDPEA